MDLSIIIVNYNTIELTKACVDSVRSNTDGIDYEIIVVDNNSSDGSRDFLGTCEGITFIESGDNLGFGRANNLGFKHSIGRYILMLNSDTIVENNILTRMVNHFDSMPDDVACIGSILIHEDRQPCFSHGFFTKWQWEFGYRVNKGDSTSISGSQQDVEYVSGADLFVRRWVAEKYGLFDPDFFMYYEDMEIGYRYKQNGLRSVLLSEQGIVHLDGASSKSSYRKVCMTSKSYITYLRKTLPYGEFILAKSLIVLRRLFTVWHYRWTLKNSLDYVRILATS